MRALNALFSALSLCAAPLAAQGSYTPVPFPTHTIDWPAALGGAGSFQRIVTGRFTPHDELSAVVLKGGGPVLVYRPAHFTAMSALPGTGVTDVAVLHSSDQTVPDAVVCAGPTPGLVHLRYDADLAVWSSQTIGSSLWTNARRVQSAQLDAGEEELIGIDSTGMQVLVLAWSEAAGVVLEAAFPMSDPAHDLEAIDWDDDGDVELVVLTDDEIEVYDAPTPSSGPDLPIASLRTLHPGGALAPLAVPGALQRIGAVLRNGADTWNLLFELDDSTILGPETLAFPFPGTGTPTDVDLVDVAAGDWDGDADLDLLLTHSTYQRAYVLNNVGSATDPLYSLSFGDYHGMNLSGVPASSGASNLGLPAFADLDNDPQATADVLVPVDTSDGLVFGRTAPQLPSTGGGWQFFADSSLLTPGPTSTLLTLRMSGIPLTSVQTYDYVQVAIWQQADPITPNEPPPTQDAAIYNLLHAISDDGSGNPTGDLMVDVDIPIAATQLSSGGWVWPNRSHVYLLVRLVDAAPDGSCYLVTDSSDARVLGMTLPSDESEHDHADPETNPAYQYLIENGYQGYLLPLYEDTGGPTVNLSIGAIVPQPGIAPFAVPSVPYASSPCLGPPTVHWTP